MGLGPSGQEALTQQREVTGTHYLSTHHYQDIWEQAVFLESRLPRPEGLPAGDRHVSRRTRLRYRPPL